MSTKIFCQHNVQHADKEGARHCPGHGSSGISMQVLAAQVWVTEAQLDYIGKLGGDVEQARHLTRKGASTYIDQLKSNARRSPVTQSPTPSLIPLPMLAAVPEGRYAVRPDSVTPWTFIRLTRPRNGQWAGCTKVQTQHGDNLLTKWTLRPDGRIAKWADDIEQKLLLLVVGWHEAAIDYGREIGRCCRCGKHLTDERSRWYGIGPECEGMWPWLVREVDEKFDVAFYPGIKEDLVNA